jgi:hypothetical protein
VTVGERVRELVAPDRTEHRVISKRKSSIRALDSVCTSQSDLKAKYIVNSASAAAGGWHKAQLKLAHQVRAPSSEDSYGAQSPAPCDVSSSPDGHRDSVGSLRHRDVLGRSLKASGRRVPRRRGQPLRRIGQIALEDRSLPEGKRRPTSARVSAAALWGRLAGTVAGGWQAEPRVPPSFSRLAAEW